MGVDVDQDKVTEPGQPRDDDPQPPRDDTAPAASDTDGLSEVRATSQAGAEASARGGAEASAAAFAQAGDRAGADADPQAAGGSEAAEDADELAAAQAQIAERDERLLRLGAELENLRRRNAREVENAHKFAAEKVLVDLLPVRDSLEEALRNAGEAGEGPVKALVEGTELTLSLLDKALDKAGVILVDPQGEPFDPERHQAMSMVDSDAVAPNHVAQVLQKGCVLNERLVRPALVLVAKAGGA